MEFKDKIYEARMQLNLSQEKIAKELGVSFATVNRWENGITLPNKMALYKFEQLCKKYHIVFN